MHVDTLIAELRRIGESALADQLERAEYGSTSGEILADIGAALRPQRALRKRLSSEGRQAWDAAMADVNRAYPGWSFRYWIAGLWRWRTR